MRGEPRGPGWGGAARCQPSRRRERNGTERGGQCDAARLEMRPPQGPAQPPPYPCPPPPPFRRLRCRRERRRAEGPVSLCSPPGEGLPGVCGFAAGLHRRHRRLAPVFCPRLPAYRLRGSGLEGERVPSPAAMPGPGRLRVGAGGCSPDPASTPGWKSSGRRRYPLPGSLPGSFPGVCALLSSYRTCGPPGTARRGCSGRVEARPVYADLALEHGQSRRGLPCRHRSPGPRNRGARPPSPGEPRYCYNMRGVGIFSFNSVAISVRQPEIINNSISSSPQL